MRSISWISLLFYWFITIDGKIVLWIHCIVRSYSIIRLIFQLLNRSIIMIYDWLAIFFCLREEINLGDPKDLQLYVVLQFHLCRISLFMSQQVFLSFMYTCRIMCKHMSVENLFKSNIQSLHVLIDRRKKHHAQHSACQYPCLYSHKHIHTQPQLGFTRGNPLLLHCFYCNI